MSTHSSYLLAWSSVLTEDLFVPIVKIVTYREVPTHMRIWITRVFIVLIGAFILYFGLWFTVPASIWGYLAMTGTIYVAGAMTLVACGLYFKWATTTGAYMGLLGGALPGLFYLFLHITSQVLKLPETNPGHWIESTKAVLAEPIVGVISFPLAFVAMVVGSILSKRTGSPPGAFEVVTEAGGEA
jgi:SSS family solute:Na+ symporter